MTHLKLQKLQKKLILLNSTLTYRRYAGVIFAVLDVSFAVN